MKGSTFANANKVVVGEQIYSLSNWHENETKADRSNNKERVMARFRIGIIITLCMLFGMLPLMARPIWRTVHNDADFVMELIESPDLIFVGAALWISYIGSAFSSQMNVRRVLLLGNVVIVSLGIIIFVIEKISEELASYTSVSTAFIVFHVLFCILQLVVNIAISINSSEKLRRISE